MFKQAIPVLHVNNAVAAEEFYCKKLGFTLEFATRADESKADPCYMGFKRDAAWLHISSFSGDGTPGAVVFLVVDDVDALHEEFMAKHIRIDLIPTDQTWGNREMYVRDPYGNCIRFIQERWN